MPQFNDPYVQELFRVGREIRNLFVQQSPVAELSAGQFQMMCSLYHTQRGFCPHCDGAGDEGGMKITELAHRMHNAVPTISQRADELEALGYLQRQRSRQDRRTVYLVMTPEGQALMKRAMARYSHFGEHLVARLGEERLHVFLETLNDLKIAIAAEQAEILASAADDTTKEQ
ncbi:MarR family winged helix-turn-helix transcriptional regulator [Acidaminobacterium chupaoyuni]